MKRFSFLIILLIIVIAGLTAYRFYLQKSVPIELEESIWLDDFSLAIAKSTAENLPIMLYFTGSDWCRWCHKLDEEVFSELTFIKYATANFILFMADFPNQKKQSAEIIAQNERLLQLYDVKGFPTVIVISTEGEIFAETGYIAGGAENWVINLITQMRKDEQ